jgi:hypothetical protein
MLRQCLHAIPLSSSPSQVVDWSLANRDPIIPALHLMYVAMSQDRLIDAVSLSTVCKSNVFDDKNWFALGLHILWALRDASSGALRDTIQQLFCSRQITRLSILSPSDVVLIDLHYSDTFPFPDPVPGSNA